MLELENTQLSSIFRLPSTGEQENAFYELIKDVPAEERDYFRRMYAEGYSLEAIELEIGLSLMDKEK